MYRVAFLYSQYYLTNEPNFSRSKTNVIAKQINKYVLWITGICFKFFKLCVFMVINGN